MWLIIEENLSKIDLKRKFGRPLLDLKRTINGIYYALKTGCQWNAVPRCFGSSSAIHRAFTKLVSLDFFKQLWHAELLRYNATNRSQLFNQALDCSHVKAPLGQEQTGNSPVDRRKLGTKRSIVTDSNGVVLGCALGSGNQHDQTLFVETVLSIPRPLRPKNFNKTMHLDAAFDSADTRTALFNLSYIPRISPNKRRYKLVQKTMRTKRWFVERTHSWMNRFRKLLIRYEKRKSNDLALMHFVFAIIVFRRI